MQDGIPEIPQMASPLHLTLHDWRVAFEKDFPAAKSALLERRESLDETDPAWITLTGKEQIAAQLQELEDRLQAAGNHFGDFPLLGVPFAVKDNIDVAGMPTTAACPAFSLIPREDAAVVARLKAAGAIVLGKTNLDQFATGLVGTRSPYGSVPNAFQADRISGGSSSGSASVVARGLVAFALGTDTAGSGRVPASFNNLIGLKPTRGALSTNGVLPACKSLDCVSIFALTVDEAETVFSVARGYDETDGYSRAVLPAEDAVCFPSEPVFGVPAEPKWFGDEFGKTAYAEALGQLESLGVTVKKLDFTPMHELALLLYNGPWVAERLTVIEDFLKDHREEVHPVVRGIIEKGKNFSAVDTYRAEYRRMELARQINATFDDCDALLVPTAPTFPTTADVLADPVEANSRLGTYTNFVNLADCSALALPAGFRADGLPFGITLIAPAWRDQALAAFGKIWARHLALPLGATGRPFPVRESTRSVEPPADTIRLAVVGAHLTGMPLNGQLTERGAMFVETTRTSDAYRLYSLPGTTPPKPGLIRTGDGAPIEVELWDMPVSAFGSFVALVPAPLGIGTLELSDGRMVKGFICESHVQATAEDITAFGGWKAFMNAAR